MIAVDIGNTKTSLGLFQGQELIRSWRFRTEKKRLADEFFTQLRMYLAQVGVHLEDQDGVCISSVVPELTGEIRGYDLGAPLHFVSHQSPIDFHIKLPSPQSLGPDIICVSQACIELYDCPIVMIDAGTATTVMAINENKEFIGGAICPGLGISSQALFKAASALSAVTLTVPPKAIGQDTESAVQSGLCRGHAAMIEGLAQSFRTELGRQDAQVVMTGGAIRSLKDLMPSDYVYRPDLALQGLRSIFSKLYEQI
ncbi:MAG: type III pantothenate kinase [Bdellovibrionales bacterium]|nr:type III pantothenate kinase [Bdellovibrionales bacterium]